MFFVREPIHIRVKRVDGVTNITGTFRRHQRHLPIVLVECPKGPAKGAAAGKD